MQDEKNGNTMRYSVILDGRIYVGKKYFERAQAETFGMVFVMAVVFLIRTSHGM